MNAQNQYKISFFTLQIRKIIEHNILVQNAIQFFHFIWIIVLLFNTSHSHIFTESQVSKSIKNLMVKNLIQQSVFRICYILIIVLNIILLINGIIFIRVSQGIFNNSIYKKTQKGLIYISTVIVWLSQLLIYPAGCMIMYQKGQANIIETIVKGFILGVSYYMLINTISKYSLYRKQTLFIVFNICSINDNIIHLIISLIVSCYQFIITESILSRIFITPVISSLLSVGFILLFNDIFHLSQINISLFIVIINVVVILYIVRFNHFRQEQTKKLNSFEKILTRVSKLLMSQKIIINLSLHQINQIFQFFLKIAQSIDQTYYQKLQNRLNLSLPIRSIYDISEQMLLKFTENTKSYYHRIVIVQIMIDTEKTLAKIYHFMKQHDMDLAKMPFVCKIRYIQMLQKLKKNYGTFMSNTNQKLQILQIQQVNYIVSEFRQDCNQIMHSQIQFWQQILKNKIHRNLFYSSYEKLELLRKRIRKNKQIFVKYNIFHKFKCIYKICQRSFKQYDDLVQDENNLPDQHDNNFKPYDTQSNALEENQEISDKYFLISDTNIIKISHSLALQLKIKQQDFQTKHLRQLVGPEVSQYLMEKVNYMTQKSQKQWFQLPFFIGKYKFIAFKARILWYPTLSGSGTYMIDITTVPNTSFLYYNVEANEVSFFSDHFIYEFDICESIINGMIDVHELKYEELFLHSYSTSFSQSTCQLTKKYKQRQKSYVPLEMKLHNVLAPGSPKFESQTRKKVFGKGYDYIYMDQCMFTILEIKSFKIDSMKDICKRSQTTLILPREEKGLEQINENQHFFCLIPNSYEDKIAQKIASFKTQRTMRGWMWLLVVSFLYISFSISQNIYTYYQYSAKNDTYLDIWKSISQGYQEYILMYKMYKKSSQVYHALKQPQNIMKSMNLTSQEYIMLLKAQQQKYLKQFLQKYLSDFRQQPNHEIQYKIDFNNYQIQTSTQYTSLMDFASNFKKNIDQNEFEFLLQNYHNFRELSNVFQSSINFQDDMQDQINQSIKLSIILLLMSKLLIVLMVVATNNNQKHITKIIDVYAQIKNEQIQQKINSLKKDLNTYFETKIISSQSFSTKQKSCPSDDNQQISSLQNYGSNKTPKFERRSLMQRLMFLNYKNSDTKQFSFDSSQQNCSEQAQKQKPAKQKKPHLLKRDKQYKDKEIVIQLFRSKLKYSFFIFISSLCCACMIINLTTLLSQGPKYIDIFNYQNLVYQSVIDLNRLIADTYVSTVYEDNYGYKNFTFPDESNIMMNVRFQSNSDFDQIKYMQERFDKVLEANLCQNQQQKELCYSIGNGVLSRGYSQAFIIALDASHILQQKSLSYFANISCTQVQCPLDYQFGYVVFRLSKSIEQAVGNYKKQFNEFNERYIGQKMLQMVIKILVNILISIGLGIFIMKQRHNGQRAYQLFKYIPKSVISKIRITNYIRKQYILQALQTL